MIDIHYDPEKYQNIMIRFEIENKDLYEDFRNKSRKAILGDENCISELENLIIDNTESLDEEIIQVMTNIYLKCISTSYSRHGTQIQCQGGMKYGRTRKEI